jgi:hypothetical protein
MGNSALFDEGQCEFVEPEEIRRIFNEQGFFERAQSGEFRVEVKKDDHLSKKGCAHSGEPFCTRTQILWYLSKVSGGPVACVHPYLRRDGSLGASGKPDPKYLRFQGRVLKVLAPVPPNPMNLPPGGQD